MDNFKFYFLEGWQHIVSWDAIDHLLFLAVLIAGCKLGNWKKILLLITGFTLGHSFTLAVSVYDIFRINTDWAEFLIPLTIAISATINLIKLSIIQNNNKLQYALATFFGLIHGMGFANIIRFQLAKAQSIFIPLLSFNIGLEVGQIAVVACMLAVTYILTKKILMPERLWTILISSVSIIASAYMCIDRFPK